MSHPLSGLSGKGKFTAESVRKLESLGYVSIEEVASAALVSPHADTFLGFKVRQAIAEAQPQPAAFANLFENIKPLPKFPLGVRLERIPTPSSELLAKAKAFAAPPALPPRVSLIPGCPPIRDQQNRGTCVAFSTLGAYELANEDFSEQFVYALCKQRDGIPNDGGTWLAIAYPVVRDVGVCPEATWPYVGNPVPGNEGQNPPPPAASAQAGAHRRNFVQLSPTHVQGIKAALASGKRVSFSVPVFDSWYQNNEVARTGNIVMPFPGEPNVGGHAMTFVGYADDASAPGGGRFQIRNSWDSYWATQSTLGAGYGTLPYDYVANHGAEAYHFV